MSKVPYMQEADEYQAWAIKTMQADYNAVGERLCADAIGHHPIVAKPRTLNLLHAAMGICTESGEFFDPIKKHLMYGKPLDEENMREELGDLLWYIAVGAENLGTCLYGS